MKTKLTIIAFFVMLISVAQNGINYKALIKDTNGNVIANEGVDIVFSIQHEGVTQYSELQQIITDNNGIAIATIGVGSVITGAFNTIDWKLRQLDLNVQIDFGDGLIDFGNSLFNAVPYAINTLKPQGLEAIDEGNGLGWRLANRDLLNYANIGENAIDFSTQNFAGDIRGASGTRSVALGIGTEASGTNSFAMGTDTTAEGYNATAFGVFNEAIGSQATTFGFRNIANAFNSFVIGRYNIGGGNPTSWSDSDPLFEIGNGSSSSNRNNALTVSKSGLHTINSSASGLNINADYNGVVISQATNDGIIISAGDDGLVVSAVDEGARITGGNVGIYASGGQHQSDVPDIILGSHFSPIYSDDGIISTDPNRPGSDMFLRSYDAVVIQLDYDNNEAGNFRVRNGAQTIVFDVNESGNATLAGSLTQNSDRRLKMNIEDLPYGLNEILQLQPKSYHWKANKQDKKSLGLIAQEVQPIISEIVTAQDDDAKTLGISYTELIPILINAIKEQQEIIKSQGKELEISKNNYETLLTRIEQLESKSLN